MKALIILLASLLVLGKEVYAAKYFDFIPYGKFVGYNNAIKIDLFYNLVGFEEEQFVIRPVVDTGIAFIFNEISGEWIPASEVWTKMPNLGKNITVKVMGDSKVLLGFKVQNTLTNEIYETPLKELWLLGSYGGYLQKLNNKLTY